MRCSNLSAIVTILAVISASSAADWPCWRGPTGQGVTDEKDLPITWGGKENENVLWKAALPGTEAKAKMDNNQSSPIAWRDRVILSMVFWPATVEDKDKAKTMPKHLVACYQTTDGKKLWETEVPPGPWQFTDLRGGYSAPTPATDGERIYALFGSSVLAALDFEGKLLWRKEIVPFSFDVAIGTSPVLYQDTVLVLCDQTAGKSRLAAFDKKTGDIKWEQKLASKFSHTTPLLIDVKGKPQLLIGSSNTLQGMDPADGKVIWSCNHPGDVTTPVFAAGIAYCDSGRGQSGIAVDVTGQGDVTKTNVKWQVSKITEGFYSSPVIFGDHIYRAHAPGLLKCWKLATGEEIYNGRLPQGIAVSASPIVTPEGRVYFASAGKSVVIAPGPQFEVLAVNDLGEPNCQASPAVSGGRLFLKGPRHLYCVGKK